MHKTNLRKVGYFVMLAADNGRFVIEPQVRAHHRLEELLAQCDDSAEIGAEDRAWLSNRPAGDELL